MLLVVLSLPNTLLERTLIINDITQDRNKVQGDESNKHVKFHRLEKSMDEALDTFQSVVEAEQRNGGPSEKSTTGIK